MPVSEDSRDKDIDYSFRYARRRDPTVSDPTVRYTKETARVFMPRIERFEPGDRLRVKYEWTFLGHKFIGGEEVQYIEPSKKYTDWAIVRYMADRWYCPFTNLTKKGVLP